MVEMWGAAVAVCYSRPMSSLNIRKVGDGPKRGSMWLDSVRCITEGFHEWPKVGDTVVIHGVLYRLVDISNRWVWEPKPSISRAKCRGASWDSSSVSRRKSSSKCSSGFTARPARKHQ